MQRSPRPPALDAPSSRPLLDGTLRGALRALSLALLAGFVVTLSACDSSMLEDEPPEEQPPAIAAWEGAYTGHARFGGANGRWGNGGTYRLVVGDDGTVTVGGEPLVDPIYDPAAHTLVWSREDGNATNGAVTFRSTLTSSYFFADLPGNTAGQNMTGSIQNPGEGPLDYRGLLE